jgi:hypothetical protein
VGYQAQMLQVAGPQGLTTGFWWCSISSSASIRLGAHIRWVRVAPAALPFRALDVHPQCYVLPPLLGLSQVLHVSTCFVRDCISHYSVLLCLGGGGRGRGCRLGSDYTSVARRLGLLAIGCPLGHSKKLFARGLLGSCSCMPSGTFGITVQHLQHQHIASTQERAMSEVLLPGLTPGQAWAWLLSRNSRQQ